MRLIDADALKEKIRDEGIASTYKNIQYAPTIEAAPDWHYIEDGTPEEENDYLITWEDADGVKYVTVAWYDYDEKFIDYCYRNNYMNIIAWAELPKPAKGK